MARDRDPWAVVVRRARRSWLHKNTAVLVIRVRDRKNTVLAIRGREACSWLVPVVRG